MTSSVFLLYISPERNDERSLRNAVKGQVT